MFQELQRCPQPVVDYRKLRFKNLVSQEFRHLFLLLYWPVYGLLFLFVERFYKVDFYYPVHCVLDDIIPFCEYFVIPYLFWFVYLIGMHIYTLLYDVEAFKKMMGFIIITYTVTIMVYFLFPTCQQLRPQVFVRENVFTSFMQSFYRFDTNTNVCPSIHVIGSLAAMFTSFHCKGTQKRVMKSAFVICAVLICMSTVFLKQHSLLDVLAAVPVCAVAYLVCFKFHLKKQ